MFARLEGDVNGVEFFMGVDVKSRRDFAPESHSTQGLRRSEVWLRDFVW